MRVRVLVVGKGSTAWADAAVDDYARRLRRHGQVEEVRLKPERFRGDEARVRAAEGRRILDKVGDRDLLVALDERGQRLSTPQFADLLREARLSGATRLVFAIGGPYGHDPGVRSAARRTVRLSDLVLNHEVARVVLYEQLYRAAKIVAGEPYHH